MLKYDDIWNPLQEKLSNHLGIEVIQAEGMGDKPEYPFVTIKKISGPIKLGTTRSSIDNVGVKTITQDIELVYSITVNAQVIEEAEDTALKAQLYFEGRGYEGLMVSGITIVDVMPPENRDVFLTVDYERRIGFDVKIRTTWSESYGVDTIDQVILGGEN
ncbi:phage neck terminator protein [Lysinibacillus sp. 54212]|uniref:phage neck terminator protein n=1 Tax=Lysinibacillus sp. 54212 TaxID=3119829 RepID=UPI002FCB9B77